MLKKLQKTFSLSDGGRKQLLVAIIFAVLHNLSVILPTFLLFAAVSALLKYHRGEVADYPNVFIFTLVGAILLGLIFFIYKINYDKSYGMSKAVTLLFLLLF